MQILSQIHLLDAAYVGFFGFLPKNLIVPNLKGIKLPIQCRTDYEGQYQIQDPDTLIFRKQRAIGQEILMKPAKIKRLGIYSSLFASILYLQTLKAADQLEAQTIKTCLDELCKGIQEFELLREQIIEHGHKLSHEQEEHFLGLFRLLQEQDYRRNEKEIAALETNPNSDFAHLSPQEKLVLFLVPFESAFHVNSKTNLETNNGIVKFEAEIGPEPWAKGSWRDTLALLRHTAHDKIVNELYAELQFCSEAEMFYRAKYGTMEQTLKHENAALATLKLKLKAIDPNIRDFLLEGEYARGFKRVSGGKEFSLKDLGEYFTAIRTIALYFRLLEITPVKLLAFSNDSKFMADKGKNIASHRAILRTHHERDRSKGQEFIASLNRALSIHPDKFRYDEFSKLSQKIKEDSRVDLTKLFPPQIAASIKNTVEDIRFAPPKEREQFLSDLETELKDAIQLQRKKVRQLERTHLFKFANAMNYGFRENYTSTISDLNALLEISDASFAQGRIVRSSWLAVHGGEQGLGILRHEIGHQISRAIQTSGFKSSIDHAFMAKLSSCLNSMHPEAPAIEENRKVFLKLGHYYEEDFADLFAAVAGPNKEASPVCFFSKSSREFRSENIRLNDDPHSNVLFRILHHELAIGKQVPASCHTLLEKYADTHIRNCFQEAADLKRNERLH